jgi:hypothetical protein
MKSGPECERRLAFVAADFFGRNAILDFTLTFEPHPPGNEYQGKRQNSLAGPNILEYKTFEILCVWPFARDGHPQGVEPVREALD